MNPASEMLNSRTMPRQLVPSESSPNAISVLACELLATDTVFPVASARRSVPHEAELIVGAVLMAVGNTAVSRA